MTKTCHSDPKHLFTLGKARIWAGSKDAALERDTWTLMVSALSQVAMTSPISANAGAKATVPAELLAWEAPPMLGIDWPDQGVPRLRKEWWEALVAYLATVEGDVVVFCFGGHGRTGTALSILACLGGVVPQGKGKKGCPVTWVRKQYCTEAVETEAQVAYIERITGRKVLAVGSNSYHRTVYVSPHAGAGADRGGYNHHAEPSGGAAEPGLPFGVATKQESASFENLVGGRTTSTAEPGSDGEEPVKEVLYRWNDEYGNYWTDEVGNIVAVSPEEDDPSGIPQSSEADDLEASEMP